MSKRRRKLKSYERCRLKCKGWRCALPLNHEGWCHSKVVHGIATTWPAALSDEAGQPT